MISIKRIYDPAVASDGYRILVDRLWPRGVSKERAAIDEWIKDIAPSNELRVWFGHKPEKFHKFEQLYISELENNSITPKFLQILTDHKKVTLLYGAKNPDINNAVVLLGYFKSKVQD